MSIKVLSLFDASCDIRDSFISKGCQALSLDIHPGYNNKKVDIQCDILDFNYQAYNRDSFNFMYIALPCQCYSIASGGLHFKNNIPVTSSAINSINVLIKIYQIQAYFDCDFILENPSGGLCNNSIFNSFFNCGITRLSLDNYGFVTQKKTDLFTNFPILFLVNKSNKVKGRYSSKSLDNLTYRQRVKYPAHYVDFITNSVLNYYSNE